MRPRLNQRIQFSLAYVLVAAMVLLLLQSWLQAPRTVEIPMSKFLDLVRTDKIDKVALTEKEIRGIAKPDALPTPPSGPGCQPSSSCIRCTGITPTSGAVARSAW